VTEADFQRLIAASPHDIGPRLAFADWLEEQGDLKRAEQVRAGCRYRLPIAPQETRHLAAIAAARQAVTGDEVVVAVESAPPVPRHRRQQRTPLPGIAEVIAGLHPESRQAMADDLRHLAPVELARAFPRDDRGRLELDCVVLLAQHASLTPLPPQRAPWLAAVGPARRGDPQVITVRVELVIGENHPHNWSRARWWWDDRHTTTSEEARWGITGAALREVTGPERGRRVAELEAKRQKGKLSPRERILLCTVLQDCGRFEEALCLCDVEYPDELSRILDGEWFRLRAEWPNAKALEARPVKLRRELWESAPWRFAEALANEQARLDAWTRARSGRGRKRPQARLFILPGAKQARRPGLMMTAREGGRPRLVFDLTAANTVLPETDWKRPMELDVARWCDDRSRSPGRNLL
jgi:uncharacterized protein (TIGR02996 family)